MRRLAVICSEPPACTVKPVGNISWLPVIPSELPGLKVNGTSLPKMKLLPVTVAPPPTISELMLTVLPVSKTTMLLLSVTVEKVSDEPTTPVPD